MSNPISNFESLRFGLNRERIERHGLATALLSDLVYAVERCDPEQYEIELEFSRKFLAELGAYQNEEPISSPMADALRVILPHTEFVRLSLDHWDFLAFISENQLRFLEELAVSQPEKTSWDE